MINIKVLIHSILLDVSVEIDISYGLTRRVIQPDSLETLFS